MLATTTPPANSVTSKSDTTTCNSHHSGSSRSQKASQSNSIHWQLAPGSPPVSSVCVRCLCTGPFAPTAVAPTRAAVLDIGHLLCGVGCILYAPRAASSPLLPPGASPPPSPTPVRHNCQLHLATSLRRRWRPHAHKCDQIRSLVAGDLTEATTILGSAVVDSAAIATPSGTTYSANTVLRVNFSRERGTRFC